jgi:DNA-binding CsgD family transcriptional regulator
MRAGMKHALSLGELSRLIGLIYDCALDRDKWSIALEEMRTALDFANGVISVVSLPDGRTVINALSGIEAEWVEQMPRYGADVVEQWGGPEKMAAFPVDQPLVLSVVSPNSQWMDTRFYREWGKPQGLCDALAMPLAIDRTIAGSLTMGRHGAIGEINEIEMDAARLLLPHVQRAVAISKILDFRARVSSRLSTTLDHLSVAVVLVDQNLKIVHANTAADTLLADGNPIHTRQGYFEVKPAGVQKALAAAVASAAANPHELGRRGMGIPLRGGELPSQLLHVLPLQFEREPQTSPTLAVAAIFVTQSQAVPVLDSTVLAALFDLTATEACVFIEIAKGRTRSEASQSLGVAENTIKTHLARIFLKTGARGQADLRALGASLARP